MDSKAMRAEITARIATSLSQSNYTPWLRPWRAEGIVPPNKVNPNVGVPTNCVSGRLYRGVNPLILNMAAYHRGYASKWWGTEKQWARLKCRIKAPPPGILASTWPTKAYLFLPPRGNRFYSIMRRYDVYNVEQVEGPVDRFLADKTEAVEPDYRRADEIIAATGARFAFGGNEAIYRRPLPVGTWPNHTEGDYIQCPRKEQFHEARLFYATAFHELVHWSEIRLGWKGSYEMGELVAEMGGVFACEQAGVPTSFDMTNHLSYLKFWLDEMRGNDSAIFLAAAQASRAVDHIFSFYEKRVRLAA